MSKVNAKITNQAMAGAGGVHKRLENANIKFPKATAIW